jgi:hypothetical protein
VTDALAKSQAWEDQPRMKRHTKLELLAWVFIRTRCSSKID